MRSSRWLVVYLFAVSLAASVWVGTDRLSGTAAWLAAIALAILVVRLPFPLEPAPAAPVWPNLRDVFATLAIALPSIVLLAETWRGEFPTLGDQFLHNGFSLEAYAFWFALPWLAAVIAIGIAIVTMRRNPHSSVPLIALGAVAVLAMLGFRGGFAGDYPALVHFLSVPFRALVPATAPLDVERLVNLLSIPGWLLLLRPRLLGRHADVAAMAAGALLFWQKDVAYYVTSGYLEPWGVVLLLTAGEHLLRFRERAHWRVLLLIGVAAVIKEQMIVTLPVVALVFFPRRERWWPHIATLAVATTPFALFLAHPRANAWRGTGFALGDAFRSVHAGLWRARVVLQFGTALPVVLIALAVLLVLAVRNRGAAALALAVTVNLAYFYLAGATAPWPALPRLHLVPLGFAALALGVALEHLRPLALAAAAIAVIAAANAVPLLAFLRTASGPSDALNFFEHSDAPIYLPVREALEHQSFAAPHQTIEVLNDAKWLFPSYYPGLIGDQYPDLAARYDIKLESFKDMPQRCRCTGTTTKLAVFVRFTNIGVNIPARPFLEAEAAQCRAAMEATCKRRQVIVHDRTIVGLLGR